MLPKGVVVLLLLGLALCNGELLRWVAVFFYFCFYNLNLYCEVMLSVDMLRILIEIPWYVKMSKNVFKLIFSETSQRNRRITWNSLRNNLGYNLKWIEIYTWNLYNNKKKFGIFVDKKELFLKKESNKVKINIQIQV